MLLLTSKFPEFVTPIIIALCGAHRSKDREATIVSFDRMIVADIKISDGAPQLLFTWVVLLNRLKRS